jgi:hypothetical protein
VRGLVTVRHLSSLTNADETTALQILAIHLATSPIAHLKVRRKKAACVNF